MEADERFAVENVEQLVAYSDYVLVFTVTNETQLQPTRIPEPPQSYMIQRDVTASVDRVLWSSSTAPAVADSITFRNGGWWVKDGEGPGVRATRGDQAMLVGQTFVAGFVGDGSAGTPIGFGLTSSDSTFAVEGDRAVTDSPFELSMINDLSLDELAAELERVGMLPEIRAFDELGLDDRGRADPPG